MGIDVTDVSRFKILNALNSHTTRTPPYTFQEVYGTDPKAST
jgi:hypothetical protein